MVISFHGLRLCCITTSSVLRFQHSVSIKTMRSLLDLILDISLKETQCPAQQTFYSGTQTLSIRKRILHIQGTVFALAVLQRMPYSQVLLLTRLFISGVSGLQPWPI